jgi:hypothetical protein
MKVHFKVKASLSSLENTFFPILKVLHYKAKVKAKTGEETEDRAHHIGRHVKPYVRLMSR